MLSAALYEQYGILGLVIHQVMLLVYAIVSPARFENLLTYEHPTFSNWTDYLSGPTQPTPRNVLVELLDPHHQRRQLTITLPMFQSVASHAKSLALYTEQVYDLSPGLSNALFALSVVLLVLYIIDGLRQAYRSVSSLGNNIYSFSLSLISKCQQQPLPTSKLLRKTFLDMPKCRLPNIKNHPHPASAAMRNLASSVMNNYASMVGRRPYNIQMSTADVKSDRSGCRSYYWMRDMEVNYSMFWPKLDDVMCFSDVDYYMDMPAFLVNNIRPCVISTVVPGAAAKWSGEYTFTIDRNNQIHYHVSGGSSYIHKLWDYGPDIIVARLPQWFGLLTQYVSYSSEKRQLDDHHQMVLLTPLRSVRLPWFLPGPTGAPLERMKFIDHDHIRLYIHKPDGIKIVTGVPETYVSAELDADEDAALSLTAKNGSIPLNPAMVKQTTGITDQITTVVLSDYHRLNQPKTPARVYIGVKDSVYRYQFDLKSYNPEANPSLQVYMGAFVRECYAPDICPNNDRQAIQARITDIKPPELELSESLMQIMEEFAAKLVPNEVKHTLYPNDIEDVFRRQPRPAQQYILRTACFAVGKVRKQALKTFQKRESYEKANDPRIITTLPGSTKLHYSRYIYAFAELVMATDWYAFGKTPKEIAIRVSEIAQRARVIAMTDLSRMDGRVSNLARILEKMLLLRAFHPETHPELVEEINKQTGQTAYTAFGIKFTPDYARNSGSPETAVMNSIVNAFMAFYTLRSSIDPTTGCHHTADSAWNGLGIYGGDDGLSADMDSTKYPICCSNIGQQLTIDEVKYGEPGVKFLAREYSSLVWYGGLDSMCDVPRQLAKFHTTHSTDLSVTPMDKLTQKCAGYILSDRNTPVIGPICRTVEKICGGLTLSDDPKLRKIANYFSKFPSEDQFPNFNPMNWMEARLDQLMPTFDFCGFTSWINDVNEGKSEILKPHLFDVPSPLRASKGEVVVDGDVFTPEKPSTYHAPMAYGPDREPYPRPLIDTRVIDWDDAFRDPDDLPDLEPCPPTHYVPCGGESVSVPSYIPGPINTPHWRNSIPIWSRKSPAPVSPPPSTFTTHRSQLTTQQLGTLPSLSFTRRIVKAKGTTPQFNGWPSFYLPPEKQTKLAPLDSTKTYIPPPPIRFHNPASPTPTPNGLFTQTLEEGEIATSSTTPARPLPGPPPTRPVVRPLHRTATTVAPSPAAGPTITPPPRTPTYVSAYLPTSPWFIPPEQLIRTGRIPREI